MNKFELENGIRGVRVCFNDQLVVGKYTHSSLTESSKESLQFLCKRRSADYERQPAAAARSLHCRLPRYASFFHAHLRFLKYIFGTFTNCQRSTNYWDLFIYKTCI